MAIVKPIKVRKGNLAGLRAVIDYIKNESKTDKGALVFTKDCLIDGEFHQMVIAKRHFGKDTGRQYAHFVQSFSRKDDLTAEKTFEIGKQYIERIAKFKDFQVVMAVHTDNKQFHIHYIINSVSYITGQKWQSTPLDLKHMRTVSDELCRENNLYVIEHGNRGHQSYGEYTANQNGASWKQRLAQDITDCLFKSNSRTDFHHALDERGIEADFGKYNVMFTVTAGTYGLDKDMKCGNNKLMSYGDFSKQNIESYFKANKGLLQLALEDMGLVQDAFLEVGKMLFPNNPTELQDRFFGGMDYVDFDTLTREEIEIYLKRKKAQQLQLKAWTEWDKQSQSGGGQILARIADTLAEIIKIRKENQLLDYFSQEHDNEYEL